MLRKTLYTIFLILLNLSVLSSKQLDCDVAAESAILINGKTGKVLFAKSENKLHYPASLTKIATAIYALNIFPKEHHHTIMCAYPELLKYVSCIEKRKSDYKNYGYFLEEGASIVGLKQNEKLRFEDLLHALMLRSAGDAANVIAYHLGNGSIDNFMKGMNQLTKSIGCSSTKFMNPHGLFHPEQVTTCVDMARLCLFAMNNKKFREVVGTAIYEQRATNLQPKKTYVHSNQLLKKGPLYYPYAIGIKTGHIYKAKYTFAGAAEKDGRMLIAVLLRCPDRNTIFRDTKKLFELAYSEKKHTEVIIKEGKQDFQKSFKGSDSLLTTYTKNPLTISYYPSEEPEIRTVLSWDELDLPIKSDTKVGEIQLLIDNKQIDSVPLYSREKVDSRFMKVIKEDILSFFRSLSTNFYIATAIVLLLVVAILIVILH